MAPSFNILQEAKKAKIGGLKKNKIRKPVIEKMRRDRINHSIEQLRLLLEKDIQIHHQNSKLEKADILEMAVKYLQKQRQQCMNDSQNAQDVYYQGYYMCLKETVGFLHSQENTQGKILRHICMEQSQTVAEHSFQYAVAPLQRYNYNASEGNICFGKISCASCMKTMADKNWGCCSWQPIRFQLLFFHSRSENVSSDLIGCYGQHLQF